MYQSTKSAKSIKSYLTLPSMILSGPAGPLGGCLVIVLDSKSVESCRYHQYVTVTGEVQMVGAYWYGSPLRKDVKLLTDGAFLVFRDSLFHLSATLWLKKFRRGSVFEITMTMLCPLFCGYLSEPYIFGHIIYSIQNFVGSDQFLILPPFFKVSMPSSVSRSSYVLLLRPDTSLTILF